MNTALATTSYISVSPARKAFAFKPGYKTACRVAIGINTILAAAFLLSFPLLRIADAKCPVVTRCEAVAGNPKHAEGWCIFCNNTLHLRKASGKPQYILQRWKHLRYAQFIKSPAKFQVAHKNWRFDW